MNTTKETVRTLIPVSDICESGDLVSIRIEMPGVGKDHIELRIDNDLLVISADKPAHEERNAEYLVRERRFGRYVKQFTLDDTIDRERIDAVMKSGVLTLNLHRKESAKPKRIEIRAS